MPDHSPNLDLTRRGFAVTTLAAGFALAVQPVSAEAIRTEADGLEAGEVAIPTADGKIPAYRARPEGAGPFPTVLVVQEIFGVHEHIKDICRRFAKLGYLAIAPGPVRPRGRRLEDGEHPGHRQERRREGPRRQVMTDLDATVAWAKAEGKGDTDEAGHHRLLLGRPHRLAVRRPQPDPQGRASPGTAASPARRPTSSRSTPSTSRRT